LPIACDDEDDVVRRAVRAAVLIGIAIVAAWATSVLLLSNWWSDVDDGERVAIAVLVAGVVALPSGATWLSRWRPSGRSWRILAGLSLTWSLWGAGVAEGGDTFELLNPALLIRPLLFWVILGWPTGRLSRGDAGWLAVYSVVQAITFWGPTLLTAELRSGADNPIAITDAPRIVNLLGSFGASVVLPLLLIGSTTRKYRRLPKPSRTFTSPVLAAAIVVGISELALVVSDYLGDLAFDDEGATSVGVLVLVANYLPCVTTPLLLVSAARRTTAFGTRNTRRRTVEVGPSVAALPSTIAAALGDPSVIVAYRRSDRGWVGSDGSPIELGGAGRTTTVVERNGEPIAAIEYDAEIDQPTTVELAVAAAGAGIEFERIRALANARMVEAARARRTIVAAQDDARQRLERDLHDGVQQRLVGLALQANLAARQRNSDPDAVALELRTGIRGVRKDLEDVVAGVLPSVLAERGLEASLATLAATAPMAVELQISHPATLDPEVAAAAWFVVSEAVANASKHSGATRLVISGGVNHGRLAVSVHDDGCGGADASAGSGLAGLADRVARASGTLSIDSPPGGGTLVEASFPIAVAA
jgi:signal transduction histidine kinase